MCVLCVCRPEGLGVVCGMVYLVAMFLFIPVPFLHPYLINAQYTFQHHEVCGSLHIIT